MRACWMFMILLSCRLSHATKCICNEVKVICAPVGNNVLVPCPAPDQIAEEVTFDLFKNEEVIYKHTTFFRQKNVTNSKQRHAPVGVELRENTENKSVSFMLSLDAGNYGLYRCESKQMFPPPFVKTNSSWILILLEGHQCNLNKEEAVTSKTAAAQKDGFLWIWILGVALLVVYGLTVSIIAGIIWCKWKESDSQSDYMNTKPKAPRDRKKKRGVQIPVPHYF